MKSSILIFLIVTLFWVDVKGQDHFTITGKVLNSDKDYVLFVSDTTGYGLTEEIDTIKTKGDGSFSKNVPLLKSEAILAFYLDDVFTLRIPAEVNTSIDIVLDARNPDSIQIKGEQAAFVQYHLDQQNFWKKIFQEYADRYPDLAKGRRSSTYFKVQDSITDSRISFLNSYFNFSSIKGQKDFIRKERKEFMYSNLYYRMSGQKPQIIRSLAFFPKGKREMEADTLTFSNKVDINDKEDLSLKFYREFFNDFIFNAVKLELPDTTKPTYEILLSKGLSVIDEWFTIPEINALQKLMYMNYIIESSILFKSEIEVHKFQFELNRLSQNEHSLEFIPILELKLQKLNTSLGMFAEGADAPDFILFDKLGKSYTLSELKGTVVLIDVWASWCGPCIANFPKWESFAKENANNKEILFLTVSLDEDAKKWINALEKYKLSNVNLHSGTGGFKSSFAKSYEIRAIPSYIAIDREGKFIAFTSTFEDFKKKVEIDK